MIQTWEAICAGICSSLTGKEVEFKMNTDWQEVFDECKMHGICTVVYNGIKNFLPPSIKNKWDVYNLHVLFTNLQIIHEQNQLINLLKDVPFCILKGTATAVYYPNPLLRTLGDIDFIVSPECFSKAYEILSNNGYEVYEEDNIRHITLMKNDVVLELHHRFGYDKMNIDEPINRCYNRLSLGRIKEYAFPMLPDLENGLILLAHLRQHLYSGIGIRQVLDWMMYVEEILNDEFWTSYFQKEAHTLGMEKLAIVSAHMCKMFLGLNPNLKWCEEADEELCQRLMDNIIESGNFGHNHGSGKAVEKTMISLRKEGFFRYLQLAGEHNWKVYQKHPWLKPFAWVYQIGRYIRQGIQTGRSRQLIHKDIIRSTERYKLLKDLGL